LSPSSYPAPSIVDVFDRYDEWDVSGRAVPFLCRGKRTLSLRFDVPGVQSLMDTEVPWRLMLRYTRVVMGFLLFNERPRHLGIIGLGGGSIPKYCFRHLPHTRITVAEINPQIIALRHQFFIPDDDERFSVLCEDGADFVRREQREFDVLIIDGFDNRGQPPQLCSKQFYEDCCNALTPDGILVVNVCDSARSVLISRLRRSFRNRVIVVDGEYGGNTIAFACEGAILGHSDEQFASYANLIEQAAASMARVYQDGHPETF
jgi:spermidine synthase